MADDPNHFYVTLFSTASPKLFPDNKLNVLTVELAHTIDLGTNDRWEVGVCEFTLTPNDVGTFRSTVVICNTNALIYYNLIQPQFVSNKLIRCLRKFITPSIYCEYTFDNIYYLPVEKTYSIY